MHTAARPRVRDLGNRRPFAEVHESMLALRERIHRGGSPGEVWLLEHEAVYTAGRATPAGHLADPTVQILPIERGGKVTFHGPGQLVIYPIVRLPRHDVRAWLRSLEGFGMAICERLGLETHPASDGTGVFARGRKVASIGVHIKHWINVHGIAVNVDMDLASFEPVRPCGLDPTSMSDLSRELSRTVTMDEAKEAARSALPVLVTGE